MRRALEKLRDRALDLEVTRIPGLQVGRIVPRDVSSSAAQDQPRVRTFIEFHAGDETHSRDP
jgi:hypothetical protein